VANTLTTTKKVESFWAYFRRISAAITYFCVLKNDPIIRIIRINLKFDFGVWNRYNDDTIDRVRNRDYFIYDFRRAFDILFPTAIMRPIRRIEC
jgi:hypothetical protein